VTRVAPLDATLDTCVLVPITLCDTLLRFAEAGFYRPHWSQETLDELVRNLVARLGLAAEAAQRRVGFMRSAFPEALVTGYQRLIPSMTNAPKDRHVLAAAIRSGSRVIVTSNVKDFPAEALGKFAIEAQPPDLFLLHQSNPDPRKSVAILRKQASEKARPPRTLGDHRQSSTERCPRDLSTVHTDALAHGNHPGDERRQGLTLGTSIGALQAGRPSSCCR
jgi:hypothetical protein